VLWFTVFLKNRKKFFESYKPKRIPSITFIIPAYNEEKNIGKCLEAILSLDYPKNKLKVMVVDDGSTDNTAEIVRKFKKVKLIRQKNSGKAAALNNGLKYVNTELVACMDADSLPEKDFLLKMVGFLEKKEVASVTPAIKVLETKSIIQKIQWVEYNWFVFLRKVFDFFDCQHVIPGPGSIYKTEILKKVGGFDVNNLTEDTEIAFRLNEKGFRIKNSIDAHVYTDAPRDFKSLYKQRVRWYRGYIQNSIKYSRMIANPNYGNLGFFILPVNFVWMFILGFLLLFFSFNCLWNAFKYLITWSYINFNILAPEIKIDVFLIDFYTYFGIFFLIFNLIFIYLSIVFSREKIDLKRKLSFYLGYILIYPFLNSFFWVASIIYEIAGVKRKW
jgi:cellulose synthase/poly-beta-1,6-N-acetylglucosamine synthase-like glycosyltransferase